MSGPASANSPSTGRCSQLAAAEPLIGTAPLAEQWLVVEQPGPWGPRVLEDTLPERLREGVASWQAANPAAKVLLARRPGRHPARDPQEPRWVWFAGCSADPPRLLGARLGLDQVEALLQGHLRAEEVLAPLEEAWFGVCTNGRRDQCCALSGVPLAQAGARLFPQRVWEVSHLGGHRFAPTVLHLPHGYLHGRVADISVLIRVTDAGRLHQSTLRGRSSRQPKDQAVESIARAAAGRWGLDDWSEEDQDKGRLEFDLRQEPGGQRPESCGAEPVPYMCWAPSAASI